MIVTAVAVTHSGLVYLWTCFHLHTVSENKLQRANKASTLTSCRSSLLTPLRHHKTTVTVLTFGKRYVCSFIDFCLEARAV